MNEHHLQEEIEFYEKHKLQDFLKPFQLRSVSESKVQDVLQKIHSCAIGCDGMSLHMFKIIPDLCLKSLTDIVNCSIDTKVSQSPKDVATCRLRGFETCLCLARTIECLGKANVSTNYDIFRRS
jgi:hypothetical protein